MILASKCSLSETCTFENFTQPPLRDNPNPPTQPLPPHDSLRSSQHAEDYNEQGAAKFKGSPRLYNYTKREKQRENPHKPDNTRALGEFRHWEKKVEKVRMDKI